MSEQDKAPDDLLNNAGYFSNPLIISPGTDAIQKPTPLVQALIDAHKATPGNYVWLAASEDFGRWKDNPTLAKIRNQLQMFAPDLWLDLIEHTQPDGTKGTAARLISHDQHVLKTANLAIRSNRGEEAPQE